MKRKIVWSLPLPCLAALTLACLVTPLQAEDTSWSIIQVDESILPALFTPMSHLVASHSLESATVEDESLGTSRAAVVRAVITHHQKTSTNQLNTENQTPLQKIEMPRAKDFTPVTTTSTISHPVPVINSLSFAMMGR
jgi:hypothetical protein